MRTLREWLGGGWGSVVAPVPRRYTRNRACVQPVPPASDGAAREPPAGQLFTPSEPVGRARRGFLRHKVRVALAICAV